MGVISRIIPIANADAMRCSRDLAQKEGIFVGITGRHFCWCATCLCGGTQGRDAALHVAGYG